MRVVDMHLDRNKSGFHRVEYIVFGGRELPAVSRVPGFPSLQSTWIGKRVHGDVERDLLLDLRLLVSVSIRMR